jgi:hypothetical protein
VFCKCGEVVDSRREVLGHKLCLACGDIEATKEILSKQKRTGILCHKSGIQYFGDGNALKQNLLDAGKKTNAFELVPNVPPTLKVEQTVKVSVKSPTKTRQRVIGVYWIGREKFTWHEGVDPVAKGATRTAKFR